MEPQAGLRQHRRDFLLTSAAMFTGSTASIEIGGRVHAADGAPDLSQANLPQVPFDTLSTRAIFDTYAVALPDTPWRRAWNESYAALEVLRDELWQERVAFIRAHGSEFSDPLEAHRAFDEKTEHRMLAWEQNYASLESGGERIVDGSGIIKQLGMAWGMMDCHTYCFEILRRGAEAQLEDAHYPEVTAEGIIGSLLMDGFYPVNEPADFDVVVYGNASELNGRFTFGGGHYGMCKDGLVVSKDIMSIHVYKHPVEESAAYSTHVMYFRHRTHPDPRAFPLPAPMWDVTFKDVDGIATPVFMPYSGTARLLGKGALIYGGLLIASKVVSSIRKRLGPTSDASVPDSDDARAAE